MDNSLQDSKIRNFSIIAHIDHGKSTLADRIIEITQTDIGRDKREDRILDRLDIEQEKGITIKLQACKMTWKDYELNLIDTPGHVDFSYEVSRSLAACEAALLLVDASQGIQAQTISNAQKAIDLGLKLIPVLNKIDVPGVKLQDRIDELNKVFGFMPEEIIPVSGKTGENVDRLLDEIIEKCPPAKRENDAPLKALIFDSFYDEHKGVIVALRIFQGKIIKGREFNELFILQKKEKFKPTEVGFFAPTLHPTDRLHSGEVGYLATGLKDIKYFTVGDTISDQPDVEALAGYQTPKPNVFATFFPTDSDDYEALKIGLSKIGLNDAALTFTDQRSSLLGSGFRCGFLGLLHMEITQERLEREYDVDLIITAPTVEYHVTKTDGKEMEIQTPQELPDESEIQEAREPWVRIKMLTPQRYMASMMELLKTRRGEYVNSFMMPGEMGYIQIEYDMPLASLVSNFFDSMKNLSSGYASMEYEMIDFFPVDLAKVEILINKESVPALGFLEVKSLAREKAAKLLEVMKEVIPRQQFKVSLQASIGATIIAREDISGFRKDVTAKLYGGDYSRKKKLLEKQKKGKKRLKQIGQVHIPQDAFLAILKT